MEYWHNWFSVSIIINEKKLLLSRCKAFKNNSSVNFNTFQDEGGEQKVPHPLLPVHHYNCFPCNFFHVGISPKTFLASIFNLFAKYVQNIKAVTSVSPRSMNLNQDHSLTENARVTILWLHDNIYNMTCVTCSWRHDLFSRISLS